MQARADQSATTQASRQSWLEQACRQAFICTLRCVLKTKEEMEIFPAYSWCDVACTLLFFSAVSISSMHAASGLFSWTMELLAFESRMLAPKTTMSISVRFLSHSHLVQFFLVSERSGRRKPPAERSALYSRIIRTHPYVEQAAMTGTHSFADIKHAWYMLRST